MNPKDDTVYMQLFEQMNQRLDSFEKRLASLQNQVNSLKSNYISPASPESAKQALREAIQTRVKRTWEQLKQPTKLSELSRIFNRRSRAFGGLIDILQGIDELTVITQHNGSSIILTKEAFDGLSKSEQQNLTYWGLSEKVLNYLKETQKSYIPPEPDDPEFNRLEQELFEKHSQQIQKTSKLD